MPSLAPVVKLETIKLLPVFVTVFWNCEHVHSNNNNNHDLWKSEKIIINIATCEAGMFCATLDYSYSGTE